MLRVPWVLAPHLFVLQSWLLAPSSYGAPACPATSQHGFALAKGTPGQVSGCSFWSQSSPLLDFITSRILQGDFISSLSSCQAQGEKKVCSQMQLFMAPCWPEAILGKRATPWTPCPWVPLQAYLLQPWILASCPSCDDSWSLLALTSLRGFKHKEFIFSFKS